MVKVTIIGAAGGIGQPLSLLAKLNPKVTTLAVYDLPQAPVPIKGVAADLSHIPTPATVIGYCGEEELGEALKGADVVMIPAGVPRKPGMTRDDLLGINAKILGGIAKHIASSAPKALVGVITNPVNAMVPMFVELLIKLGVDRADAERRVFGVTTLDTLRARTFLAPHAGGADPAAFEIPVVGGHAGTTIVPIFSQTKPFCPPLADAPYAELVKRTQFGGDEVVKAKAGAGSATLSMAAAGSEFLSALINALTGTPSVACAYVRSNVFPGTEYFASKIRIGPKGIIEAEPIGTITPREEELLKPVAAELASNVQAARELVGKL